MGMLLRRAQTDPFSGKEILLTVNEGGLYRCILGSLREYISIAAIEYILTQDEWPIYWDSWQIYLLCDLLSPPFPIARYVKSWVTSTSEQANSVLQAKLQLLRLFVKHNKIPPSSKLCVAQRLIVQSGGVAIKLLGEDNYSDGCTPWVRHRSRKLILVREWMLAMSQALFSLCNPSSSHQGIPIDQMCSYAQTHNLQGQHIWHTDGSSEPESDWETEEEWEEGPMRTSARGAYPEDVENLQKRHKSDCTCQGPEPDYDEDYWSYVFDRNASQCADNALPDQKRKRKGRSGNLFVWLAQCFHTSCRIYQKVDRLIADTIYQDAYNQGFQRVEIFSEIWS